MFYHRTALEGKSAYGILYSRGGLYVGGKIIKEVWQSFIGEGRTPAEFDIGPPCQLCPKRTAGMYCAGFGIDRYGTGKQFTDGHAKSTFVVRSEERRVGKECRSRWWP